MINIWFTKNTDIQIIENSDPINFDRLSQFKIEKMANLISEKTGVPKNQIYMPPYISYIDRWYNIDDKWYFFKEENEPLIFINELLGVVISRYFNLETVNYRIAQLKQKDSKPKYGIISENFCDNKATYKTSWDYKLPTLDNMDIFDNLRLICKSDEEYKLLLDDIKKFFIRDFYASQEDRSGINFLFSETESGIRLAPLFDYESSFFSENQAEYINQLGKLDLKDKKTIDILQKDSRFQELLNLLMSANIKLFLEEVEDTHQIFIPPFLKNHYKSREETTKKLIKQYGAIKD